MAGPADIEAIIRERAAANGVDPDTLLRMAHVESGLDPNSANPSSSARGLFQFTAPTWRQYGNGADPLDPTASADAGARFTANNQKLLGSAGIDPTPGATYLAHFAGPGGALKVLRSDPSAPVSSVLDAAAIKANPFLANMSVADLKSWADRKMSGTSTTARPAAPTQQAATIAVPGAMASAGPGMPAAGADAQSELSPELMTQLAGISKMLGQQDQQLPAPPQMQMPSDPSTVARMRIVQRALAGQPITG